ncbi:hypothetical protein P9112_009853 [Eukaryota sp. TZLM1-RC]
MDTLLSSKVTPNIEKFSCEISADEYSTKGDPRNNVIISSNGLHLALDTLPTNGDNADAHHIKAIVANTVSRINELLQQNTKSLTVIEESDEESSCSAKILWITMDGARVNTAAASQLQDCDEVLMHSKCTVYSLNLVLKDFVKKIDWVKDLIDPTALLLKT